MDGQKNEGFDVEGSPDIITYLKSCLADRCQLLTAVNGQLRIETAFATVPDIIISDVMMPEMDGWEVYQKMKASEDMRDIPVIVVTAKAQSIDRVLGLHIARVNDYITKPFGPQELLDSVERVLNNNTGS